MVLLGLAGLLQLNPEAVWRVNAARGAA